MTAVYLRRSAASVALVSVLACAPRLARPPAPTASVIDTLPMRAQTFFLAHDLLLGRGTGTSGGAVAALYIESECRARGLLPVGGTYAHPVPMDRLVPRPAETRLQVGDRVFRVGEDFLLTGGTPATLRGFAGRPVTLGTAEDIRGAPDALPRLEGAVAVVPGVVRADLAGLFGRRGAAAIVQVVDDASTFALYAASRSRSLTVLREDVPSSFYGPLPSVIAGPAVAAALRDTTALVELVVGFDRQSLHTANVACLLPGTDPGRGDTAIVLTAHYDHLGVSLPDASGDSIYNGFSDDAVGVAMLFAVADAAHGRRGGGLRHGLLLLFFTGEERGLLGSDYFVAHPPYPLDRMRALVNLDAGAPPSPPWTWRLAGGEGNPLGDLARDVASAEGWSATVSPATPTSDYFPFARNGVPAVLVVPGPAPYQGLSADSSQVLRRRWDRYHQPGDHYDDAFPFRGVQRYAEYAFRIVEAVDGTAERRAPNGLPGRSPR